MDYKINIASFEEGWELQRLISLVAKNEGFKVNDLIASDKLDKLVNIALAVNSNKEVYNALWTCLGRCLYNGEKITKETFEDLDARKQFLPIAFKCIEVNLEPFTDGLVSLWKMLFVPVETSPKQE